MNVWCAPAPRTPTVIMKRILVLCRSLPDSTKSSGELRFSHLLRQLERRCERLEIYSETGGNAHRYPDLPIYTTDELPERCAGADLAFLEFWFMDLYLPVLREAGIPILLDSVDIEFLRRERERQVLGLDDSMYRVEEARERAAYEAADQVWVVSEPDGEQLPELRDKLVVIPNLFDPVTSIPSYDEREGAVFVGSYHHQPNVDALRWYREAILPRLDGIRHRFFGNAAPDDLTALPGFVGPVDDSTAVVSRARVSIAPLRYGAGLKGKVLEAMACGTPVVTTPIGDEGYGAAAAGAAIVAESPAEFAAAIRRIDTDRGLWEAMSASGLRVAERFQPSVVGNRIDRALDRLLASRSGSE
jgi:glycosyltransferase involved in cell wall biosynthesis